MKVAFFIFGSEPRHWNTGLEIALREFTELNELEIIWVAGKTPYIPFYSIRGLSSTKFFNTIPKNLIKISSEIEKFFPDVKVKVTMLNINLNTNIQKNSVDFLQDNLYLKKLNSRYPRIEEAITNALIYETRNKWASIISHKKLCLLLCKSYAATYDALFRNISNGDYQHIIIFNGRFIHEKAVWAVSEALGIDRTIFECLRDRYILFEYGPHERFSIQNRMKNMWDKALTNNANSAIAIASEYFESLNQKHINRFVPKVSEPLKEHFDFSFFIHSDDEAIGLGKEWVSPMGDNFQITRDVIRLFESGDYGTLAIKIHPNLVNKAKEEQKIWSQLKGNNFVRIFDAKSNTSAFHLVANSKFVITTGSTVGAEAVYKLRPVAVLAPARYDQLGGTNNISSLQELQKWCESVFKFGVSMPELKKNRIKILALGYWMAVAGTKHELLETELVSNGGYDSKSFLGVPNTYSAFSKITDRLAWYLYFLKIGLRLRIWKR